MQSKDSVCADAAASRAPLHRGDLARVVKHIRQASELSNAVDIAAPYFAALAAGACAVPSAHGRPSNDALKSAAAQLRLGNHRATGNDAWEGNCIEVSTWLRLMADEQACAVPETQETTCSACREVIAAGEPRANYHMICDDEVPLATEAVPAVPVQDAPLADQISAELDTGGHHALVSRLNESEALQDALTIIDAFMGWQSNVQELLPDGLLERVAALRRKAGEGQ